MPSTGRGNRYTKASPWTFFRSVTTSTSARRSTTSVCAATSGKDASGRSIAVTTIRQQPDGWVERGGRFVLEGRNVVTPDLAPGRYDVVMHHASIGTLRRSVEIVAGKVFELRVP